MAWHPIHPLLVSGGSEGSILHWDLTAPPPTHTLSSTLQPGPRATLAEAHDSNVWSIAFHPLGHLLVSASNDHTTRFWSRERPGDASAVFSAGGEKPPAAPEAGGQEEEDEMVPGFPGWQGEDDPYGMDPQDSYSGQKFSAEEIGGLPGIPGLGGSAGGPPAGTIANRQAVPLPSQADMLKQAADSPMPPGSRWGARKRFS